MINIGELVASASLDDKLTSDLYKMASGVGDALAGVLTLDPGRVLQGLSQITSAIIDIGKQGSEIANMSGAFYQLADAAGFAGDELLNKTRVATRGLVTDFQIMEQANKAMLLGLQVTPETFAVLTSTAIALGQAMRREPAAAMNDIIVGLGRMSPRILDNLGIMVKATDAYKKYADANHKLAASLTLAEKQQAFYNATVDAAKAKFEAMGGIQISFAQRLMQLQVAWQNFTNEVAMAVAQSGVMNDLLQVIGDTIMTSFGESQKDAVKSIATAIDNFVIGLVIGVKTIVDIMMFLNVMFQTMKGLWESLLTLIAKGISFVLDSSVQLNTVLLKLGAPGITQGLVDGLKTAALYAKDFANMQETAMDAQRQKILDSSKAWDTVSGNLEGIISKLTVAKDKTGQYATAAKKTADEIAKVAEKTQKEIIADNKRFELIQKAIGGMGEEMMYNSEMMSIYGEKLFSDYATTVGKSLEQLSKDDVDAAIKAFEAKKALEEKMLLFALDATHQKIAAEEEATKRNIEMNKIAFEVQKKVFELNQKMVDDWSKDVEAVFTLFGAGGKRIAESMGEASSAVMDFSKKVEDGEASLSDVIMLAQQLWGAFKKATDSASAMSRAIGGAMVGARAGAGIGAMIAPVGGAAVGAVIGGVVGAIAGIFHKPSWAKVGKEAGKTLGVEVGKELAQAIEKTAKELDISTAAASLLHIGDAIEESGKAASTFGKPILDLMSGIVDKSVPAVQGIEAVGDAFTRLGEEGTAAAKQLQVGMIQAARAAGLVVPEIQDAVKAGLDKAIGGVGAMVSGIKLVDSKDVDEQAQILGATFWAKVKEDGVINAALAMSDIMKTWKDALAKSGIATSEETAALLAPINDIMNLAATEGGKNLLLGIQGLQDALTGLGDAGYMTMGAFQGFEGQAQSAFDQLIAGGASTQTALTAIAPLLGTLQQQAAMYGLTLDSNTQSLINQANTMGIAFPTDPMQKVVDILAVIAVQLGATLPASFTQMAGAATAAAGTVNTAMGTIPGAVTTSMDQTSAAVQSFASEMTTTLPGAAQSAADGVSSSLASIQVPVINIPINYDIPPIPLGDGNSTNPGNKSKSVPKFDGGSGGLQDFGQGTWAVLHNKEAVLTEDQYHAMAMGGGKSQPMDLKALGYIITKGFRDTMMKARH